MAEFAIAKNLFKNHFWVKFLKWCVKAISQYDTLGFVVSLCPFVKSYRTILFSSFEIASLKLSKLKILKSNFLSKRLRNKEHISVWEVVAIVKEHSFEFIQGIVWIYVQSSFINDSIYFDWLNSITGSFPFGTRVCYLEIYVCVVLLSLLVLDFEKTSWVKYNFFLAESNEKTELKYEYCSVS